MFKPPDISDIFGYTGFAKSKCFWMDGSIPIRFYENIYQTCGGTHPAIPAVWCAKSTGLNLFEIPSSKKSMGLEDVSPTIFGLGPWSGHFVEVRNWCAASINHWENPCDRPTRIWISEIIPGSQHLFVIFYNHILVIPSSMATICYNEHQWTH
jgi:hypothetical protein